MTLSKRQIWFLAIALAALVLLSLFAAPGGSRLLSGSTYGRSPDGYGAWYAFMQARGVTVHRWQKPLKLLFEPVEPKVPSIETFNSEQRITTAGTKGIESTETTTTVVPVLSVPSFSGSARLAAESASAPITLLQIGTGGGLSPGHTAWVKRGNVLVLVGVRTPTTNAPFTSTIASPTGKVRIQTSRRKALDGDKGKLVLGDRFGAVVWQQTMGKGRVIFVATPNLAANAYQDFVGNFEFLASLVTQTGNPIWVDEYSHGFKDADVIQQESTGTLLGYLAKTPLVLVAIQTVVILLVLLWGQNRRLGPAIALTTPAVDNSEAYIQAMATVLRKAESSQFVRDTIGKAEQIEVQKALGLGSEALPLEALVDAWVQQTGQSAARLEVLNSSKASRRITESDLLSWLAKMQAVRQQLASRKQG